MYCRKSEAQWMSIFDVDNPAKPHGIGKGLLITDIYDICKPVAIQIGA